MWLSAPRTYRYHQTHRRSKSSALFESVLYREDLAGRRVPLEGRLLLPQTREWSVSGPKHLQEQRHIRQNRQTHTWLCSRRPHHLIVMAFPTQRRECFLSRHIHAFAYLGGVPSRVSYDNVATAVKVSYEGEEGKRERKREESQTFVSDRELLSVCVTFLYAWS